MKTPEQWLDENDPAWQDVCGEQPVLTKEIIAAIQSDARAEPESERDKALAANKLLVEALKKIEKCSWREKIEKCSWHGYNTYDLGAMAHEALAAVKQP